MVNYLRNFKILFAREMRVNYPTKLAVGSHFFAELVTILLYWYTAKALTPKMEFKGQVGDDYFVYIILGELVLLLPATLLYSFTKSLKQLIQSQSLDYLSVQPYSRSFFLFNLGMQGLLVRGLQFFVTIFLLYGFFDFGLPLTKLAAISAMILISIPMFIGLGLLAASIVLYFGRGERVIIMASNISYIVAGVYFPVSVFPKYFATAVDWLSPFNILLNSVRLIQLQPQINFFAASQNIIVMICLGSFLLVLGMLVLENAFNSLNRRTKPLLLVGYSCKLI